MKLKLRIVLLAMAIMMFSNMVNAQPLKADAKTKRIPAGTKLKLQLMDPINTLGGQEGYYFSAILIEDQKTLTSVILPAGSVIRGSINKIVPTKRLSRGAVLYLDFDHVVTPNGRQLPLSLSICNRAKITFDGGLYDSLGYGEAIQKNWAKTVDITKSATNFGVEIAENAFSGANYITVPFCALGGAFGGGAYFVGDSVIDLFRKGGDVILNQGSILDVILTHPIDVPVS